MEDQPRPGFSRVGPHRTSHKVKRAEKLKPKPYERPNTSTRGLGWANRKAVGGGSKLQANNGHELRRSTSFVDSIRAIVTKPLSWLTGAAKSTMNGVKSTSRTNLGSDHGDTSVRNALSMNTSSQGKGGPNVSRMKLDIKSKRRTSPSQDNGSLDDEFMRSPKKPRRTSPTLTPHIMNGGMQTLRSSISAPFLSSTLYPSHFSMPLIPIPPSPNPGTQSSRTSPARPYVRADSVHSNQDASFPKPRSSLAADDQRMRTTSPYRSTPLGSPTRRTVDGLGGFAIPASEKEGPRGISKNRSFVNPVEGSGHAVFGGINGVTNFPMPMHTGTLSQLTSVPRVSGARADPSPERDATDKIFQALEEALPWSSARKLRRDQRAAVRIPSSSGPKISRRASRMIRSYGRDSSKVDAADKEDKKPLADLLHMPKSNEAINLSAVLNVGAGADSLPKNPTNAKGRDSWKKGDEKTQPVVLQEVDEARPPPPSKTVFEKPTPSSIQSFTSDFVPLVASAVPPKSGSTVRSISSLRAPRIRSRASHEPSVRRRPNRFGIDTECEGDDDGGESEAVALKEWAKSKGIAMEVPVGWTLTDGAASTANALQAPPPAEDAKRETDLEANPAAFDKATQSTFRPAVPALVSTSSAVPHGTLSSAASKAASSSASGMPISSRPDGGSLGTTPAPPHIESASLVPPVPRSIPSFPISKLPFSLVPPTSSPPVSPEATLETTDAKQGESKSQSMMRSHLGESEITSTPENDKTPNKTSLASASESMPTIFLSPRPPPLTQTAPDHPKANSFSTFGPLRGVSASGVPTAEKSVSASLSNSTSTSTPVEQLAEGGKEESPREPVAPTSFSSGSTGATPSVRTKANGTLGFNQPPSEANAPSSPQKMEDREKAPSSAFATSSFASVGRFSLSNPETSSTPSTQSSPPSMVKTAPAISMESTPAQTSVMTENKLGSLLAPSIKPAASSFSFRLAGNSQQTTSTFGSKISAPTSTPTAGITATLSGDNTLHTASTSSAPSPFAFSVASAPIAPAFSFGVSKPGTPHPFGPISGSSTSGASSFTFGDTAGPRTPPQESNGDAGMDMSPERSPSKSVFTTSLPPPDSSPSQFSFGAPQSTFGISSSTTTGASAFSLGNTTSAVLNPFAPPAAPAQNSSNPFAAAVDNSRPGTPSSPFALANPFAQPAPASTSPFPQSQPISPAFGASTASAPPFSIGAGAGSSAGFGTSQTQPQAFGFTFQATPTASPTLSPTQGPVSSPPMTFVFGSEASDPNKPPGTPTTPRRQVKALPNRRSTKR